MLTCTLVTISSGSGLHNITSNTQTKPYLILTAGSPTLVCGLASIVESIPRRGQSSNLGQLPLKVFAIEFWYEFEQKHLHYPQ